MTTDTIEVWQDENGYAWFAAGHHDPEAFLDACEADDIKNGVYTAEEAATEGVRTYSTAADVRHLWYLPDADNPDRAKVCEPDTPGAEPYTRLPTP